MPEQKKDRGRVARARERKGREGQTTGGAEGQSLRVKGGGIRRF